jgi:hypothetical protein
MLNKNFHQENVFLIHNEYKILSIYHIYSRKKNITNCDYRLINNEISFSFERINSYLS